MSSEFSLFSESWYLFLCFLFSEREWDLCFLDDFFFESECLFLLLLLSESCACLSGALSSAEVFCFVAFWSLSSFVDFCFSLHPQTPQNIQDLIFV